MSQRHVENLIGRLATDREFRLAFAADPEAALEIYRNEGHELGAVEIDAISRINVEAIEALAASLDHRLRRLGVSGSFPAIPLRRNS